MAVGPDLEEIRPGLVTEREAVLVLQGWQDDMIVAADAHLIAARDNERERLALGDFLAKLLFVWFHLEFLDTPAARGAGMSGQFLQIWHSSARS
jgi:hypothetical protein